MTEPLSFLFSASPGGTLGRYFTGIITELGDRGHRVTLVMPPDYEGKAVEGIDAARALAWPPADRGWRAAYRLISDALAAERPDAVVTSFSGDNVLLAAAVRHRVPARLAWHHTPSGQLRLDGASGLRWAFQRRRKAAVYRLATDLLVATDHVAGDIQQQFGVRAGKIAIEPYAMPAPAPVEATPVPGRVIFVGRFYPSKGHDWLLRALPAVIERVPSLELRMTGAGGPEESAIRQLVSNLGLEDHCHFLGHISRDQLFHEVASASVAVVPSRDEGFGLVTIEAESVGTPVVASDIPPSRTTVRHRRSGLLVPLDDETALSEALVEVLTDADLRERLSAGARRQFDDHFDLTTRAVPIADTYETLTRRRLG